MMIKTPSSVLPVWGALVVAFIIGQCIYRYKLNLFWVSLIGVVALYLLIYLGPVFPLRLPEDMMGLPTNAWWIILLFVYAAVASLLPVWMLLQPRDYIERPAALRGSAGAVCRHLPGEPDRGRPGP